jgi:hypothetical protein
MAVPPLPPEPYGDGVQLLYLELLAKSPRSGGEEAVQKYYELRDSRMMALAKGTAAAAVSILTAWFIPFLKNEYDDAPQWLVLWPPVALLAVLVIIGALAFFNLNQVHRSLVRAMALLKLYR